MGKHSRCVTDICDNDMQYPELHKKRRYHQAQITQRWSCKSARINTILEGRKQSIQESLHTFVMTSCLVD